MVTSLLFQRSRRQGDITRGPARHFYGESKNLQNKAKIKRTHTHTHKQNIQNNNDEAMNLMQVNTSTNLEPDNILHIDLFQLQHSALNCEALELELAFF